MLKDPGIMFQTLLLTEHNVQKMDKCFFLAGMPLILY